MADKREHILYINVYEPKNAGKRNLICGPLGFVMYHTAIQVGKYEFSYSGSSMSRQSGIYLNAAQRNSSFNFKFSLPIKSEIDDEAVCELTAFEIYNVLIPRMGQKYTASKYHAITKNCNHFTEELLRVLTGGRFGLPGYIQRYSKCAAYFRCLISKRQIRSSETVDLDRGNVIQDLNQNSRKMSSYALLCNENVMEWTNGVVDADQAHGFDLELG